MPPSLCTEANTVRRCGIRATRYDDDRVRSIDLERGGRDVYVMVDLIYEYGLRLNAGSPEFHVQDTTVAQLEDEGLHRLRFRGLGRTALKARYEIFESEIAIHGFQRHWIRRALSRLFPWCFLPPCPLSMVSRGFCWARQ